MLNFLKREANRTRTENGAATFQSTMSDCLDFFASCGAFRNIDEQSIINQFQKAYIENPDLAVKTLFYARDVRGGLGERRTFRVILSWLAANHPETVRKNIGYIAEFGRYDDLLVLIDTPMRKDAISVIRTQIEEDLKALEEGSQVSLLGKWLPSVNASNRETIRYANIIASGLGLSKAEYRKTLSRLRGEIRIIENNLRERKYTFDYSKQPSKAMLKYRKAFYRNDNERYTEFLSKVEKGEAKLNAATLMPYELVDPYLSYYRSGGTFMKPVSDAEKRTLNATWNSLPDFTDGRNALAVVDTSGSMYWPEKPYPASVALSLGLYFAERNKGAFKNHFIEFSARPQLIELKGKTFAERLAYIASFNEVANTNLEAVFDLVLSAAVKNRVKQKDLPETLFIISDMEFDRCVSNADLTNFENAKMKFEKAGYKLPQVVFWNVASRNKQVPVTMNEQGVVLVSGCSPRIFEMVTGANFTPYSYMLEVLGNKRYECIAA